MGGAKLLERLVLFCLRKLKGMELPCNDNILSRLRVACEKAKIELSTKPTAQITVSDQVAISISLEEYNELISSYIKQTMECVENALEDADFEKEEINKIILVGGVTYTPLIRTSLEEFFGKPLDVNINPMEAGKCCIFNNLCLKSVSFQIRRTEYSHMQLSCMNHIILYGQSYAVHTIIRLQYILML